VAFVISAYLIAIVLFGGYALTLAARRRLIAELSDAARPSPDP